jgi:hypothetical protein
MSSKMLPIFFVLTINRKQQYWFLFFLKACFNVQWDGVLSPLNNKLVKLSKSQYFLWVLVGYSSPGAPLGGITSKQ